MQCEKVREKFVDYIDDNVRFTERICVEVHVARCYACREELEELTQLRDLCRSAVRHPGMSDGFSRLQGRIAASEALTRSQGVWGSENWRNAAKKLAAAAVVLFVLGISSPLIRQTRLLAHQLRDATGEAQTTVEVVPSLTRPFVLRRNELELEARLAESAKPPESRSQEPPSHTPPG